MCRSLQEPGLFPKERGGLTIKTKQTKRKAKIQRIRQMTDTQYRHRYIGRHKKYIYIYNTHTHTPDL